MFLTIKPDPESGRVLAQLAGTDHGAMTVLAITDEHIVVHLTGTNFWAGRGMRAYAPAEVVVYRITQVKEPFVKYRVTDTVAVEHRLKTAAAEFAERYGRWTEQEETVRTTPTNLWTEQEETV